MNYDADKKRAPFLVRVPSWASKRVSLIIFSAKSLWSGANLLSLIAHPLASTSDSLSGLLKNSVANPKSSSAVFFGLGLIFFAGGCKDSSAGGVSGSWFDCYKEKLKLDILLVNFGHNRDNLDFN